MTPLSQQIGINELFDFLDADGSGEVDLTEFVGGIRELLQNGVAGNQATDRGENEGGSIRSAASSAFDDHNGGTVWHQGRWVRPDGGPVEDSYSGDDRGYLDTHLDASRDPSPVDSHSIHGGSRYPNITANRQKTNKRQPEQMQNESSKQRLNETSMLSMNPLLQRKHLDFDSDSDGELSLKAHNMDEQYRAAARVAQQHQERLANGTAGDGPGVSSRRTSAPTAGQLRTSIRSQVHEISVPPGIGQDDAAEFQQWQ